MRTANSHKCSSNPHVVDKLLLAPVTAIIVASLIVQLNGEVIQELLDRPSNDDCSRFYNMSTGKPLLSQCPDGHIFDVLRLKCSPESDAICVLNATETLIPKCCGDDQVIRNHKCASGKSNFNLTLYRWLNKDSADVEPVPTAQYHIVSDRPALDCSATEVEHIGNGTSVFTMEDGSLYVPSEHLLYKPQKYCIDFTQHNEHEIMVAVTCSIGEYGQYIESTARRDKVVPVPLCCHKGQYYSASACVSADDPENLKITLDVNYKLNGSSNFSSDMSKVHYLNGWFPECNNPQIFKNQSQPFFVNGEGHLSLFNENGWRTQLSYCIQWQKYVVDSQNYYTPNYVSCEQSELHSQSVSMTARHIRKCCPPQQSLLFEFVNNTILLDCVFDPLATESSFFNILTNHTTSNIDDVMVRYGWPVEEYTAWYIDDSIAIDSQSRLRMKVPMSNYEHHTSEYCLDAQAGGDRLVGLLPSRQDTPPKIIDTIYPILFFVDVLFLLITLFIYLVAPDQGMSSLNKRRRMSQTAMGKILVCYISVVALGYCLMIAAYCSIENHLACKVIGVLLYYVQISWFTWLSTLCFEIYHGTSRIRHIGGNKRFTYYCLYAWLTPALLTGLALIIEYTPSASVYLEQPNFGVLTCAVSGHNSRLLYVYLPMSILLLICLTLYGLTVYHLSKASLVSRQRSCKQAKQQWRVRQILCFKLFLIMGITWILDMASYFIGWSWVTYVIDGINFLQPVFLFLAFVVRPHIVSYIKESSSTLISSVSRRYSISPTSSRSNSTQIEVVSVETSDQTENPSQYSSSQVHPAKKDEQ